MGYSGGIVLRSNRRDLGKARGQMKHPVGSEVAAVAPGVTLPFLLEDGFEHCFEYSINFAHGFGIRHGLCRRLRRV